jgi:AmiR/NasT family two-component response regulator
MPVIEQANGSNMVSCGWPEDQAFDGLRRTSHQANIKVRDLAAYIVLSRGLLRLSGQVSCPFA